MKRIKNILCITLLLFIIVSMLIQVNAYATGSAGFRAKLETEHTTAFTKGTQAGDTSNSKVQGVLNGIISVIRVAGMCIAITMLLVVAMKYMSAAPGEKADIKKASIAYVVGALVLFGAVGILGIINSFASNNIKVTAAPAATDP